MIKFPKSFWRIAEEIGNARNVLDTHIRENDPYYERGDKREHIETVGVLGELIALDYLTKNDKDFEMVNLLDLYPIKSADFVVNNKRFDVKSTKHFPTAHLLVNERQHHKNLNIIDMYWFIYVLNDETCEFYFVDYHDVSKWECKNFKYTNAFGIQPKNLKK
jgi:hypothetical protein